MERKRDFTFTTHTQMIVTTVIRNAWLLLLSRLFILSPFMQNSFVRSVLNRQVPSELVVSKINPKIANVTRSGLNVYCQWMVCVCVCVCVRVSNETNQFE